MRDAIAHRHSDDNKHIYGENHRRVAREYRREAARELNELAENEWWSARRAIDRIYNIDPAR